MHRSFYPLIGMCISDRVVDGAFIAGNTRRILAIVGGLGLACILLLFVTPTGDYFRSGAGVHVGILASSLLWFRLLFRLEQTRFRQSWTARTLSFWSVNVTRIYCIQWVLFGWSILLFGASEQPDYIAALIGFSVLLITDALVRLHQVKS